MATSVQGEVLRPWGCPLRWTSPMSRGSKCRREAILGGKALGNNTLSRTSRDTSGAGRWLPPHCVEYRGRTPPLLSLHTETPPRRSGSLGGPSGWRPPVKTVQGLEGEAGGGRPAEALWSWTDERHLMWAKSRGVCPTLSWAHTSAPARTRVSAQSSSPSEAARCSGVVPVSEVLVGEAGGGVGRAPGRQHHVNGPAAQEVAAVDPLPSRPGLGQELDFGLLAVEAGQPLCPLHAAAEWSSILRSSPGCSNATCRSSSGSGLRTAAASNVWRSGGNVWRSGGNVWRSGGNTMAVTLEKLRPDMLVFADKLAAQLHFIESFKETLAAVFNRHGGLSGSELDDRAELVRSTEVALQAVVAEHRAPCEELRRLEADADARLREERSKTAAALEAGGGRTTERQQLELQRAEDTIKALHEHVEQLEEARLKASSRLSNHKQATQLLQTELQDSRAQVEEKDHALQSLRSRLRQSEKNASPGAAELESLRAKLFKVELALSSATERHKQE
ncbi:hypothetical protein EYF80_044370 [Liparis tanakae]|uniref:Uncharacterized protein n=1 Tax=Liparis tanakae TaxID=230148 RepID=A0A4Z2FY08_9TELE|nr:hypothetical protein EYF80_044370 [Liparis tanakae]